MGTWGRAPQGCAEARDERGCPKQGEIPLPSPQWQSGPTFPSPLGDEGPNTYALVYQVTAHGLGFPSPLGDEGLNTVLTSKEKVLRNRAKILCMFGSLALVTGL